jgi:hypothetical protein
MLVTAIETGLAIIGVGLLAFGIYGIARNKFSTATPIQIWQVAITFPLAMWIALSGLSSLGFAGYLASTGVTKNPIAIPSSNTTSPVNSGAGGNTAGSPRPSISVSLPTPVTPSAAATASPTPNTATPTVILDTPRTGAKVSVSKGFPVAGTNSPLGSDTIWILDYDGGSDYTVDEAATIFNGKWTAFDGPGLGTGPLPFPLIMAVILANPVCNTILNQHDVANNYDMSSLPPGCKIISEADVDVSRT